MTQRQGQAGLFVLIVVLGAGWGLTQPLTKIAVSGGYRHFGLIFWQVVIASALLGVVSLIRDKGLPLAPRHLKIYVIIALTGTLLPNMASYEAARFLPSGVLSITISMVPVFAFPIALALGNERFNWKRLAGVLVGLAGVGLLIGPESSLPDRAMAMFIPLALVAPLFYGFEGNFVARWGLAGLDPVQVLLGASIVAACLSLPLALLSGHWIDLRPPWDAPDLALILSSAINAVVYTSYVWMVGRAGPVFASLVAYLVTGFGVLWAILLLGERYTGYFWTSLGLMFLAMFLVQPGRRDPVAPKGEAGQDSKQ